ncbi:hypothetical protein CRENBAI_025902 [Crenichthys baileyi]|uniref:Uncharacterized protein n=1 Tax=Crenichthys baileyi TaxID=28760 RepID=A0AAV9S5W5_9TELE
MEATARKKHMNLSSYQSLPPLQDTTLSEVPEETQTLCQQRKVRLSQGALRRNRNPVIIRLLTKMAVPDQLMVNRHVDASIFRSDKEHKRTNPQTEDPLKMRLNNIEEAYRRDWPQGTLMLHLI